MSKQTTANKANADKGTESKLQLINSPKAGDEPVAAQTNELSTNCQTRNAASTRSAVQADSIKVVDNNGQLSVELRSTRLAKETFGTSDVDLIRRLAAQVELASPKTCLGDAIDLSSSLAALHEISPRNAIEGLLAVQMIATHHHAMDSMRRASKSDFHGARDAFVNQAMKFARTFALQAAALANLRSNKATNILVEQINIKEATEASAKRVSRSKQ